MVDYDVVSDIHGHLSNKKVEVVKAAQDIFGKVKNNAMQCAVKGNFVSFDNVSELTTILENAEMENFSVRVYDENIGG